MKDQKKINQEMYAKRREAKLCLWCGKPLDREGTLCRACADKARERSKANREYYLKIGVCPLCHKRKVSVGYKSCFVCREKSSAKDKQNWQDPKKREQFLRKAKERRQKRIDSGLCPVCGKNKPETGYCTCEECRKKRKQYRKIYITKYQLSDRALWKDQGRCSRCGADEQYNGCTLCRKCYEQSVEALERGRATVFRHREEERKRLEAIEAEKQKEVKKMFHPRTMVERRNKTDKEGDSKS